MEPRKGMRLAAKIPLEVFLLIIPLLILVPFMGDFFYQPGSSFTDVAISHYPNAFFLKQNILIGNGIPLWNPTILSGYPFVADPLSGLWYPPVGLRWYSLFLWDLILWFYCTCYGEG